MAEKGILSRNPGWCASPRLSRLQLQWTGLMLGRQCRGEVEFFNDSRGWEKISRSDMGNPRGVQWKATALDRPGPLWGSDNNTLVPLIDIRGIVANWDGLRSLVSISVDEAFKTLDCLVIGLGSVTGIGTLIEMGEQVGNKVEGLQELRY